MAREQRARPPFMDFATKMPPAGAFSEPPRMNVSPNLAELLAEQAQAAAFAGYVVYPDRIEPVTVDQMYQQELPVIDLVPFRGVWMTPEDAAAAARKA